MEGFHILPRRESDGEVERRLPLLSASSYQSKSFGPEGSSPRLQRREWKKNKARDSKSTSVKVTTKGPKKNQERAEAVIIRGGRNDTDDLVLRPVGLQSIGDNEFAYGPPLFGTQNVIPFHTPAYGPTNMSMDVSDISNPNDTVSQTWNQNLSNSAMNYQPLSSAYGWDSFTPPAWSNARRRSTASREFDINLELPDMPRSLASLPNGDSYNTLAGSGDDSMDSDLLSIPDSSSDDISRSDPDDTAYSEITALVRGLVVGHTTTAADDQSSSTSRPNAATCSEEQIANSPTTRPATKRGRAQKSNENSDDEESPSPPPRKVRSSKGKVRVRCLACPFAKKDPGKYHSCFSKKLSRIRDVKQHLVRKHTPEFYCSRCAAIFPDHDSFQIHIGSAEGLFCAPSSRLDGISQHQRSQLSRKSNPKLSEQQQWFSMWDIIFPEHERPESAYVDFGFSEDFCSFKEYSNRRAISAVVEGLRTSSLAGINIITQSMWEEVRKIVADRLDSIFEEWQSNRSTNLISRPENPSSHSRRSSRKSTRIYTPDGSESCEIIVESREAANEDQVSFHQCTDVEAPVYHQGPDDEGQQAEPRRGQGSPTYPQITNEDKIALDIFDCPPYNIDFDTWWKDFDDQNGDTTISNFDTLANNHSNLDFEDLDILNEETGRDS